MKFRQLGKTGLKVSEICLGTMQFGRWIDQTQSREVLNSAIDYGCNFIDTADIYSSSQSASDNDSEVILGNWLAQQGSQRQELIIATKVRGRTGPSPNDQGLSRAHIIQAAERSLRRLRTDYIDLYQVHWPDEETRLEETLRAFDDLITSGKVRYIGCSNFPAWLLVKSLWISDVRGYAGFESVQPHYNYVHRAEFERELQPLCQDMGIGVIPYSPLGGGFLTGKYRPEDPLPNSPRANKVKHRYLNERGFMALDALEKVGRNHGATIAQTAVAWLLANDFVSSVIVGANTVSQLTETADGVKVELTNQEKEMLDQQTDWKE